MGSSELRQKFTKWCGLRPEVFRAPGRVNLIGEHTDYNDGFVMPCAIEMCARVAAAARDDSKLVIRSTQFPGEFKFDLNELPACRSGELVRLHAGRGSDFAE